MKVILRISLLVLINMGWLYSFGQNKVQYNRFNWSYFQTKHFNVYYSQGGDSIASFAAHKMEEMHDDIALKIGHSLNTRVPLILHNSHTQFEQTNVIRMALSEGIGGFTEIFKNRIVLPFEGNYQDFYHVLKHEMVHAMVNDMLFGGRASGAMRQGTVRFPLWMNEGLAEYASLGWDLSSEFFMLDATTSGYVPLPTQIYGGFLAYKGGQMFYHFLENVYGAGTTKAWITATRKTKSIEKGFKEVTETSIEEAGEIWLRELRYIYWPELGKREHGKSVARKLTTHGKDLSFFNLQPTISPDNKEIAFFSDRKSREGVFILNIETEEVVRAVIEGGTKGKHESFHSFKSGLSWGPHSKRLAIVSKSGGKDVIHIIDAKNGKVLEKIEPDVEGILSPSWSRDGRLMAFAGMKSGYMDIYVWDRHQKKLTQLTHDKASDGKPTISPSGKWVAFESDRTVLTGEEYGHYKDIYKIKIDGKGLGLVSKSPYDDKMPTYGPSDSNLIFVSNRSGIDNIYVSEVTDSGYAETPLTNLLAGCFTPSWSVDGEYLTFSLFEGGGWDVFLMKDPLTKKRKEKLPKTHFIKVKEDSTLSFFRKLNKENLTSYEDSTVTDDDSTKSDLSEVDSIVKDSLNGAVAGADSSDSLSQPLSSDTVASLTRDTNTIDTVSTDSAGGLVADSQKEDEGKWPDSSEYLDENGMFVKKDYSPTFSLDFAQAGMAVNNFAGSFGQGAFVLSDLMGDQEIEVQLSVGGNLDNMFIALGYNYLPYRFDYSVGGSYSALKNDFYLFNPNYSKVIKSIGLFGSVSYPLSVYTRFQFDVRSSYYEEKVEAIEQIDSATRAVRRFSEEIGGVTPTLYWSHDNIQWGIVGPTNGTRINASLSTSLPVVRKDIFFWNADLDVRKYWRYFKRYTLAFRVNLGLSEAISGYENPYKFWLGGDDFYLVSSSQEWVDRNNAPDNLEERFYSSFATPLRGYRFFEFKGNRKVLSNLEFRFPFIKEFSIVWPLPIALRYVTGVLFTDYGAAWTNGSEFKDEQGLSFGYGLRANLGIFILRWSRGIPYSGVGNHKKVTSDYWSLGAEF